MAGNSIGKEFVVTTFGESHGSVVGVIVDGCPAGLPLVEGFRLKQKLFLNVSRRTLPKYSAVFLTVSQLVPPSL